MTAHVASAFVVSVLACATLVVAPPAARGQSPRTAGPSPQAGRPLDSILKPKAYRLELKARPELPSGTIAMAEGTAAPAGVRFLAENLSILQPVTVTVLAKTPDQDLQVTLAKYRFDQSDRKGSTKGKGIYTTHLRTQGDLRIIVTAPRPTPFQLVVWAGKEVERPMKPVVVANARRVRGQRQ